MPIKIENFLEGFHRNKTTIKQEELTFQRRKLRKLVLKNSLFRNLIGLDDELNGEIIENIKKRNNSG